MWRPPMPRVVAPPPWLGRNVHLPLRDLFSVVSSPLRESWGPPSPPPPSCREGAVGRTEAGFVALNQQVPLTGGSGSRQLVHVCVCGPRPSVESHPHLALRAQAPDPLTAAHDRARFPLPRQVAPRPTT